MGFLDVARRVAGTLWGSVVPEQPAPLPKQVDARQQAIKALFDHLSRTAFEIDDPPTARKFRIGRERWLDEWPDNPKALVFPCVACLPGEAIAIPRGLDNGPDESTLDAFGPGTVVLPLHEHQERVVLEVWATTRFERAAIVSGLEQAFDAAEQMSGIRLELPDYFGQVARFTLERVDRVDDDDSARRRRRAHLTVRLEVDVVRLVRVTDVKPSADVEVSDVSLSTPQT